MRLPKESAEEKAARSAAIQAANKYAAEIPLRVMETASKSYQLLAEMAEKGNPASISDVGVGLLAVRACIDGAAMNVRINLAGLKDEKVKIRSSGKGSEDQRANPKREFKKISQIVESKLARLKGTLAVLHASQLVTLAGPKRPRVGAELGDLAIIPDGGMLVRDGEIVATGPSDEIEKQMPGDAEVVDATGRVVLPGFVDAHAHPVFGGNRVDEFEMRAQRRDLRGNRGERRRDSLDRPQDAGGDRGSNCWRRR